jgi:hypothetical protein
MSDDDYNPFMETLAMSEQAILDQASLLTPRTDAAAVSREFIAREMDIYAHKFVLASVAKELERELAAAQAELAEAKRDAARYRWLRQRMEARELESMRGDVRPALQVRLGAAFLDVTPIPHDSIMAELDAAIDAAMKEAK